MSTLRKLVVTAVVLMVIASASLLIYLGSKDKLGESILLPILAIAGVVCLLFALALIAIVFAKMGLADKAQALGLPEGSVRAVIALSLVVLFAIISVFLYASFVNGCGETTQFNVADKAAADSLVARAAQANGNFDITVIEPEAQGKPYVVILTTRVSRDAAEFAKQLLLLVGTLVTSVSGFYFGSRTSASAQEAMLSLTPPTVTSVTPDQVDKAVPTAQVTILGSGLDQVKSVKLANAAQSVEGTILQKAACAVVCSFAITSDMAASTWELVVAADNEIARRPFKVV